MFYFMKTVHDTQTMQGRTVRGLMIVQPQKTGFTRQERAYFTCFMEEENKYIGKEMKINCE